MTLRETNEPFCLTVDSFIDIRALLFCSYFCAKIQPSNAKNLFLVFVTGFLFLGVNTRFI